MAEAGNTVRLWLRDGSEFVGKWEKPSVSVAVEAGGAKVQIDVPINRLKRLQFQGLAQWPDGPVFRVVTGTGDDFYVDVTRSRIAFANDLGKFEPFLEEIQHIEPADGARESWHVWFNTGTQLKAGAAQKTLDLKLMLGPESVSVPISSVMYMDKQVVERSYAPSSGVYFDSESPGDSRQRTTESQVGSGGFYSNDAQRESKKKAGASWNKGRQD